MKVGIIGNGIIGLSIAEKLLKQAGQRIELTIFGKKVRPSGCASTAAAAMLNLWGEIESDILKNPVTRARFEFSRQSQPLWSTVITDLEEESGLKIHYGNGTHIIHNSDSPAQHDNFKAIIDGLKEYNEPYSTVLPADLSITIPYYNPAPEKKARAAIHIPSESWVNPNHLLNALETIIDRFPNAKRIDAECSKLNISAGNICGITLENNEQIDLDVVVVCNGASFTTLVKKSEINHLFQRVFFGVGGSIVFKSGSKTLKHCVRTPSRGLACGMYTVPYDAEHIIMGATNFVSHNPKDLRLNNIYQLIKQAQEEFNIDCWKSIHTRTNMGWRPISTDTLPMIGSTSIKGMFVATGTYRDGLFCSPIISSWLSDLILKGKSNLEEPLFAPERSLIAVYSREEAVNKYVEHNINDPRINDGSQDQIALAASLRDTSERLHDKVGAQEWGIPLLMHHMYEKGYIRPSSRHFCPPKIMTNLSNEGSYMPYGPLASSQQSDFSFLETNRLVSQTNSLSPSC
ncbi:MAG: FAD-dependent oxidoreductase [Pseudomonadota bacterium]